MTNRDRECSCGMCIFPAEGQPLPYTPEWHVAHRERHLAAFPGLDKGSRDTLNNLIEWARAREGKA